MATGAPPPVPVSIGTSPKNEEVRIFQHSSLIYWWPVWVVGFIMFGVTFLDGSRAVTLSPKTEIVRDPKVEVKVSATERRTVEKRDVLILPEGERLPSKPDDPSLPEAPTLGEAGKTSLHMAKSKNLGVIFSILLLLTIVITSVSVRGVWSIVVIVSIILLVVLFALFDIWGTIAEWYGLLRIHINAGGYLFLAAVLCIIWALNTFVFDRRTYVIFSPGQVRIREAVGQGERVFDTVNMVFHKQQNDFFKHWIWGLGAGDLEIVTNKGERFEWHNVAFVGHKVRKIEELIKTREVV